MAGTAVGKNHCSTVPEAPAPDQPSRADLVKIWQADFGEPPPKGLSTRLLALSAAYNAQVRAQGGLKPATRKRLLATATGSKCNATGEHSFKEPSAASAPGTRLVREWRGRSHVVDVLDGQVIYEGSTYPSLSAVARAITGARWSGPRFFGLAGR